MESNLEDVAAISDAVYVTMQRRRKNIEQKIETANDRIKLSILFLLSPWVRGVGA